MNASNQPVSIDDLMDSSIDDLKDLPPFIVPPVGHYKLQVSLAKKVVNDNPCIEASFVLLETLELKNPAETPAEIGTKFSSLFQLNNEFGQGAFKALVTPIAAGLGLQGSKVSVLVEKIQNITIGASLKQRKDKNDADKVYAQVLNPEVL